MREIIQLIYKINLFKRIVPSILKRIIKIINKKSTIVKYDKVYFDLNLNNPIDREIYLKGSYEKKQLNLMTELIKNNKINYFVDIGAHMGFYSINLSSIKIKTYAFEPVKSNYNQLERNKLINNFSNLKIYNLALSNENKEVLMWVTDKNKTGGYSIFDKNDEEINNYNSEKLVRINGISKKGDEILKIRDDTIAIKIDVERHELKVLQGINNLLVSNKVILQVELFESRREIIENYLNNKGFKKFDCIERDYYFKNF